MNGGWYKMGTCFNATIDLSGTGVEEIEYSLYYQKLSLEAHSEFRMSDERNLAEITYIWLVLTVGFGVTSSQSCIHRITPNGPKSAEIENPQIWDEKFFLSRVQKDQEIFRSVSWNFFSTFCEVISGLLNALLSLILTRRNFPAPGTAEPPGGLVVVSDCREAVDLNSWNRYCL